MTNKTAIRFRASTVSALLFIALSLSLAAARVDAQPREYMKKPSPDELYVSFSQDSECPWPLEHVVDGALVRSRIRRKPQWTFGETVLFVRVNCVGASNGRVFAYSMGVSFGVFVPAEADAQRLIDEVKINPDAYSSYGTGISNDSGRQFLENSLRERIERALVDYLRANFDL